MIEKAISYIRCPKTKKRFEKIEIELSNDDEIIKGKKPHNKLGHLCFKYCFIYYGRQI